MHRRNIAVISLLIFLCSCNYKPIVHSDTPEAIREGIVVAGTYKPAIHSMLIATSGIYASIDGNKETVIPWAESKIFKLPSGKHSFSIWYNWFGKAGMATGCFTLEPGQLLYLEYHPSIWGALSEPELTIVDKQKNVSVVYEKQCSN